jgi:hypothetical protein
MSCFIHRFNCYLEDWIMNKFEYNYGKDVNTMKQKIFFDNVLHDYDFGKIRQFLNTRQISCARTGNNTIETSWQHTDMDGATYLYHIQSSCSKNKKICDTLPNPPGIFLTIISIVMGIVKMLSIYAKPYNSYFDCVLTNNISRVNYKYRKEDVSHVVYDCNIQNTFLSRNAITLFNIFQQYPSMTNMTVAILACSAWDCNSTHLPNNKYYPIVKNIKRCNDIHSIYKQLLVSKIESLSWYGIHLISNSICVLPDRIVRIFVDKFRYNIDVILSYIGDISNTYIINQNNKVSDLRLWFDHQSVPLYVFGNKMDNIHNIMFQWRDDICNIKTFMI